MATRYRPSSRQATSVTARETVLELPAADLNETHGMATLVGKFDKRFLKEAKDCAYEAYKNFDSFRKSDEMIMTDYIIEFEQRRKRYEMTLPDAVLAFKLLDNASLTVKERKLVLIASADLIFASTKSALSRIFGDRSTCTQGAEAIQVKQETVYATQQKALSYKSPNRILKGTNPINKFEKRTKCFICHNVFHCAKDWPERTAGVKINEDVVENCNITQFAREHLSDNEIFVVESLGLAVIDTACSRTVCGEKWLNHYVKGLNISKCVSTLASKKGFKFGDGSVVHSFKRVVIPAKIDSNDCNIDTEVVKSDIPLLLSKTSL